MATTFISSNSISTTLRSSAMKSQVALSKATTEATNGRYADVGLTLGALTGRDVVLRAELVDVDKLVDTNVLVSGHLDVQQQRIGMLIDTAEAFQKDLFAARNSADGGNVLMTPASANLQSLLGALNVTMDGQYLFAGTNTAVARPARLPSTRRSPGRSGLHRTRRRPRPSPPATCRLSSIRPSRLCSTIRPGANGRRLRTR
jgi:flagellar hook-associated protein 3 FlgL